MRTDKHGEDNRHIFLLKFKSNQTVKSEKERNISKSFSCVRFNHTYIYIYILNVYTYIYIGCPRRKGQYSGRS
jgi:hypothetical protein